MTGKIVLTFLVIASFTVNECFGGRKCLAGQEKKNLRCSTKDEWGLSSLPANPDIDFALSAKKGEVCRGTLSPIVDVDGAVTFSITFNGANSFVARKVCVSSRGARKVVVRFALPNAGAPAEQEFEKSRFCMKGLAYDTSMITIKFIESAPGSLEIWRLAVNSCVPFAT